MYCVSAERKKEEGRAGVKAEDWLFTFERICARIIKAVETERAAPFPNTAGMRL